MTLWLGIAVIVIAMAASAVIIWVVSRKSPEGSLSDRIPTNVYTVTAAAMTLLMSFTFAAAFTQYSTAQQAVRAESSAILQMYRATAFIGEPLQTELRNDLLCYATLASTQEWNELSQGKVNLLGPVQQTMIAMDNAISTPEGQKLAGSGLAIWETGNTNLATAREERFAVVDWDVPPIVYFVLIFGSLLTIGSLFAYADRTKPGWGHVVLIIGPVFVAISALVVIGFLDSPFIQTPGSVTPEPILQTIEFIQSDLASRGLDVTPSCPTDTSTGAVLSSSP
jgi:hypothetical protein